MTAVDTNLKPYLRANRGNYIELSAPGVHVWTAGADGKGAYETGTSFAAPYVTAIAATLLPAVRPDAQATELLKAIPVRDLSGHGRSAIFGRGLALAPSDCGGQQAAEKLPWHNRSSGLSLAGLLDFVTSTDDPAQ